MELNWEILILFIVCLAVYGFLLGFLATLNECKVKWIVRDGGLSFQPYAVLRCAEAIMWFPISVVSAVLAVAIIFAIVAALGIFFAGNTVCRLLFKQTARQKEGLAVIDPQAMRARDSE